MFNFIVVFMPAGKQVVNDMKVVDAWSSSSRSIKQAERHMKQNKQDNKYGHYSQGEGQYYVCLQSEGVYS